MILPSGISPQAGLIIFYPELLSWLNLVPRRRLLLDFSSRASILSIFAKISQRHPQWFRAESFPQHSWNSKRIFLNFMQIIKSGSAFPTNAFIPLQCLWTEDRVDISCFLAYSRITGNLLYSDDLNVFHHQQGQRRVPPFVSIIACYLCSAPFQSQPDSVLSCASPVLSGLHHTSLYDTHSFLCISFDIAFLHP